MTLMAINAWIEWKYILYAKLGVHLVGFQWILSLTVSGLCPSRVGVFNSANGFFFFGGAIWHDNVFARNVRLVMLA